MNIDKLQKNHISDIDKFLAKLRQEVPLSDSQKATIAKNNRIARLRDDPDAAPEENLIWEEF